MVFSQAIPVYNTEPNSSIDSLSYLQEIQKQMVIQGEYLEAVDAGIRALKIAKRLEDHKAIIQLNNASGVIHHKLGNQEEALRVFYEVLAYEKQYPYPEYYPKIINNLGSILMENDSIEKAKYFLNKSLEIRIENNDSTGVAASLVNLGVIHFKEEDYIKAIDKYEEGLSYFKVKSDKDKWYYANVCNNIADAYIELSAFEKALNYLIRAEEAGQEVGAKDIFLENYRHRSKLYQRTGQTQKALAYKELEFQISDSLLNEELAIKIAHWQAKYEGLKKDHEIDLLNKEKAWQEQKIIRQRQIQQSLLVTSFLLVGVIYLLFQNIRARRKAQKEVQGEKELSDAYLNATDGILMKAGEDLKLTFINEKGAQLLGFAGEEEEKSIWDMLSGGKRDGELEADLKKMISGERIAPITVRSNISDPEGHSMHFSWNITRLSKEDKEASLFFSGHDLTEINYSESTIKMAMIEGQEQEKERIAKEIQDALGPLLSSSKLRLLAYVEEEKKNEDRLLDTIKLLDKSMGQLKAIAQSLSANRIKNYGLIASVMESCQEISARTKTEINFQPYYIQGIFPNELELAIYRIFQEIILFSIQYLKANTINVHLIENPECVMLNIFHDGREMDDAVAATSEWTNVNTRVQIVKGGLKTQHSPKQGYLFSISFPYT